LIVADVIAEVEAAGVGLRWDGQVVRILFPEPSQREELALQVAFLRQHRSEVVESLRTDVPLIPSGIRLLKWNLKEPPIAIETCSVVTEPSLFARTTINQLRIALATPNRWVGWSIPQLINRLEQVGVKLVADIDVAESAVKSFGLGADQNG
jgi:hypothetical protein